MSKMLRVLAGLALVCGLVIVAPMAYAEVEPGGWVSYDPSFSVQQRGCGKPPSIRRLAVAFLIHRCSSDPPPWLICLSA